MVADNKFIKDHGNEEHIPTLTDAAITLISCAENIQETTEIIIRSCDSILDTEGVYYNSILHVKTKELKKLAALYNTAAKELKGTARKLVEGDRSDKTLAKVTVYSLFLIDQMKREEYRVHQVLNMLREGCHDSHI